ncbi:MAG TPA: hypothetical protein VIL05_08940 [Thermoclostridium sp.]
MKSRGKIIIAVISIAIIGVLTYSWFNVRGDEIKGVSQISSDCTVTIKVGDEDEKEYILTGDQIEMLRTLILESTFTKSLSYIVTYPAGTGQYTILIDWNNQQDFLHIYSAGNEYISIPDQFGGKHLKINNSQWEKALKEIIALSE